MSAAVSIRPGIEHLHAKTGASERGRLELLVATVQRLSLARDIGTIMAIVRRAARELTGADGATFVLRDNGRCYYADEDAIEPLWKGKRFPIESCISGWTMLNRAAVVIPDIYVDPRIPADAYRPTFVKSLAMVPIRTAAPIGAIGNYWASHHVATEDEIEILRALADSTSVAMENVAIVSDLEARVRSRTAQLEAAMRELETFSYSVSHDLRAPVRSIDGFARALEEDAGPRLDDESKGHLRRVRDAARRMNDYIDDMLALARVTSSPVQKADVDVSALVRAVIEDVRASAPERVVDVTIPDGLRAQADATLLRAVFENLLGNAFKFTGRTSDAKIEVGLEMRDGEPVWFVRDNGAGFDMRHASKLFAPFQRLHTTAEFAGTGIGLATVQRIILRHGGRIGVTAEPGRGATFAFTLAPREESLIAALA